MKMLSNVKKNHTYSFIKHTGRWYILLPDWTGSRADLEMVAGSDTMLDKVSKGSKSVTLTLSIEPFKDAEQLTLIEDLTDKQGGGMYLLKAYHGQEINHKMWLCEVVVWVFNALPNVVYFNNVITKDINT